MSLKPTDSKPLAPSLIDQGIKGQFCQYRGQRFYKIDNYHQMPNFFISVVSAYDHWLFISSNGGLTAGRQNSERSFFPYYTEDKISDMAHCTGPLTLIKEGDSLWQPFQPHSLTQNFDHRALYKSALGDQLFFSETKEGLTFEYGWSFSDAFGMVRTVTLRNESSATRSLSILDGLQNIVPANITTELQNDNSVLLDAYKSADCYENNVAAYYLSSRLTDLAEPAESLLSNSVWHNVAGDQFKPLVSLSHDAPKQFVQGQAIDNAPRQRGQRGSYFINGELTLAPGQQVEWMQVCEVTQDAPAIKHLVSALSTQNLYSQVHEDIAAGSNYLKTFLAKTDGIQTSQDELTTVHHQANALFNMMRGGFFEDGYNIEKSDLQKFVVVRQKALAGHSWWATVPDTLTLLELDKLIQQCESVDLKRLVTEYMPISFSRRHGDPSRPWNKFSINLKNAEGESIKDYQGNWRDIFQNWEPLAYTYPKFLPSMISAFLNATTVDGYNPYRVTRNGIEWEEPEPDNQWANIGYWSDHQIIYLSKLLELQAQMQPTWLAENFAENQYSFANVPYRIKPFAQLKHDPYDSINFDEELNRLIESRVNAIGSDGKLLLSQQGQVVHTNLIEKLLTLWLAKLSNFVPDGGLWMNTQRPEWNDANNALVGWGLSIVTVSYLHRHLSFMRDALATVNGDVVISNSVKIWFDQVKGVFSSLTTVNDEHRLTVIEQLSSAADAYRAEVYSSGLSDSTSVLSVPALLEFLDTVIPVIASTLQANRRDDDLFHGYNILHLDNTEASISHLPLMLEGQVAVLSANLLSPKESLTLLAALRQSDLYREDQHTYLLYPNKTLARFIDKNCIELSAVDALGESKEALLNQRVITESETGEFHFDVNVRNAKDLEARIAELNLPEPDRSALFELFENTFNHKSFTGRSGSFFGYEGLGSTYWHMVSKLLLAVQENWFVARTQDNETAEALKACYYDVRAGIGFNKTPAQYGAFPTDPYSHTPETGIARQPGMTGQVKEELITRFGELGLVWRDGQLAFKLGLLREQEFLVQAGELNYLDVSGQWQQIDLAAGCLAFTMAQVPFVYHKVALSAELTVRVYTADGQMALQNGAVISEQTVTALVNRTGEIKRIEVDYPI